MDYELSNQAKKFLSKAEYYLAKRIKKKIEALRIEPYSHDCKRIQGEEEKVFRVRVGDYRIFYVVYFDRNLLYVLRIKKRPNSYVREKKEDDFEIIIRGCCVCGKDILVKIKKDGSYEGGNYFEGIDKKEDGTSWECNKCWNG